MNIIIGLIGVYMIVCVVSLLILWRPAMKHYSDMMEISSHWANKLLAFSLLFFRAPVKLCEALYHVVILKEDPTKDDYKK